MHNDNYRTPSYVYRWLDEIFHFDLDAACTKDNCLAANGIYHPLNDAFRGAWSMYGRRAFCNPPYGRSYGTNLRQWVRCVWDNCDDMDVVVLLIPYDATGYIRDYIHGKAEVWLPDKRIAFINPMNSKADRAPRQAHQIVIYGKEARAGHVQFVSIPEA